ncbi:GNAT family N-acetyltransferase [Nonomuraea sp. FMUSA5-5]|uniref:GNAT family N-acetyltransferase n=1 Tax=Nonomuraea composti TaxID=2720023 RepID=A0ABX1AW82_9ACTN|nr:GNAT family N-acetyltransferase [Nonomuraea sp. FMUSA5-5]NJP89874.1 GNAT family N-acetyltransferase [Nonomuraea sp. FMUSA5-5]
MRPAPIYRDLFCQMYGVAAPAVVLGEMIHWWAIVREAGLGDQKLHRQTAYVPAGYFYATHVDAPDARTVREARERAADLATDWVLYPVVKAADDTGALRAAGFTPIPWFVGADYRVREGVDEDLRGQLGKNRHGDLRRAARRAAERYDLELVSFPDITEEHLLLFDRLHRLNLRKYGHQHNHLSLPALRAMLRTPLGAGLFLYLRRPLEGGPPVQAGLNLVEDGGRTMSFVAQGIDHAVVPSSQNLYKAWFYEMFQRGAGMGVDTFVLGRGAELNKLDMGANTFYLLENHLGPVGDRETGEVERLRQRLRAGFEEIGARLAANMAQRRAANAFELRW